MEGSVYIQQIAEATGLPMALIRPELELLLLERGIDPHLVSLEQIREMLSDLVQDVLGQLKSELGEERPAEAMPLR